MRLAGSNTYLGSMTINGGTLIVSNNDALGPQSSTGTTQVNSDASLALVGGRLIGNKMLMLQNSNTVALQSLTGSNTWSGSVTLNRNAMIDVEGSYLQLPGAVVGSGGVTAPQVTLNSVLGAGKINLGAFSSITISNDVSFAFDGIISGSGELDKRGPATFRLNGDSPGFSGTTAVYDGTYKVDGNVSNSFVIVRSNATLRGAGIVGDVSATEQDAVIRADSKMPGHQGGQLEMA